MKRQVWNDLGSIIFIEERLYYQLLEPPLQEYFSEIVRVYALEDRHGILESNEKANQIMNSLPSHLLDEAEEIRDRIELVVDKERNQRYSLEKSSKKDLLEKSHTAYKTSWVKNIFQRLEEDPGMPYRLILDENNSVYASFKEGEEQFILKTQNPDQSAERYYRISEFSNFQIVQLEIAIIDKDASYFTTIYPGRLLDSKKDSQEYISSHQEQEFLR